MKNISIFPALSPKSRCGLLAFSGAIIFSMVGGCVHSSKDTGYQDEFRSLVNLYQRETSRMVREDTTLRGASTENALAETDALAGEVLFEPELRVHPHLPARPVSLEEFYLRALEHSSQIRVFSDLPLIRQTAIQEATGAFDTRLFAEGRYNRSDDPVGSTLTTGREGRFTEDRYVFEAGVRKKVATGAEVFASQELSHTDNNSNFFTPKPQGGARLRIGFIQPLLQGGGVTFNRSIIQIAEIDSELAREEFVRQAESHLMEISRTYWGLFMARGSYAAKTRGWEDARSIVEELESREDFDAVQTNILRARAVAAERQADLVRAESAVRNAEDRLMALVNDPELRLNGAFEMVPTDAPVLLLPPMSLEEAASDALRQRPEVRQAYLQLRTAAIREDMQRNERLPELNFFAEAYVAGLARDDVPLAWENQFNQGRPGGTVGLRFEMPLENNTGNARYLRRRIEMRQLMSQLQTTMETVLLEVKISVREVATAHRDLTARYESMVAAREDLEDFRQRRGVQILSNGTTAIGQLQFLLDAQQRQTIAEERFVEALAAYNVALVNLQRSKGNFLSYESIEIEEDTDDADLPVLRLTRE